MSSYFQDSADRDKAFRNRQWIVNGSLLLLREWDAKTPLAEVDLSSADFWVMVHGLLPDQLTMENAACIAELLGELVEVDLTLRNGGFHDEGTEGTKQWVDLTYESLSDHCFACGKIGHMMKMCLFDGCEGVSREVIRFGHRLRAEPDFRKKRSREWERISKPWREDDWKTVMERVARYDEMVARWSDVKAHERRRKEEDLAAKEKMGVDPDLSKMQMAALLRVTGMEPSQLTDICKILGVEVPERVDVLNEVLPLLRKEPQDSRIGAGNTSVEGEMSSVDSTLVLKELQRVEALSLESTTGHPASTSTSKGPLKSSRLPLSLPQGELSESLKRREVVHMGQPERKKLKAQTYNPAPQNNQA
ncbi:hypothetical protein Tsubulata_031744 [Turnera subulata]|uniref:CCHC-type domain-containing protein n=1 Tax=Turnera subulata TaxID=218843 RepID=A0A9Q0FXW9_9ROSI|nr:hypothetical protein Tsubulata_031744 [Turnera subulata]